jgi:hypothetical protein
MIRIISLIRCLALVNALLIVGIMMALAQDTSTGKTPTPDWDTIKKQAEAERAAAEARKAQAEAALAAFKAKIGEVPSAPFAGDVTLKDKAGITEAALLAAKAVNTAANKIVDILPEQTKVKTVLLYAAGEFPNFQAQIMFRAQIDLLTKAFSYALSTSKEADAKAPLFGEEEKAVPPEEEKAVPPAAAAGLTLDAVNKLLGFFRTDYAVGGLDIKFEDSLLIHALSGAITGSKKNLEVQLPAIYSPGALSGAGSKILEVFFNLSQLRLDAQGKANRHDKLAARFNEDAGKETDAAKKAAFLDKAKIHAAAADVWKATVGLYDGFFSKLTTVDDKGVALLTNVIRESIVAEALMNGNLLLLVKLQQSGGAYYTKKNMWTFFGGTMPFYHMGGVVASFVLLDGKTGAVLKSGVVPVHGGFVKANDLPQEINKNP